MKLADLGVLANKDGQETDARRISALAPTCLAKMMPFALTCSRITSACMYNFQSKTIIISTFFFLLINMFSFPISDAQVVQMASSVRQLPSVASAVLACTVESAKISDPA